MSRRIGFEDFVLECWSIDEAGWKFKLVSDMWWEMTATSEVLGKFRAVSLYQTDVEDTLGKLLAKIKEAKDQC